MYLWAPAPVVAALDAFGPDSDEAPAVLDRLPGYTPAATVRPAPAAPPARRDHPALKPDTIRYRHWSAHSAGAAPATGR